MKVKEKSEEVGLKLNIQKTKIMASSPITSWQIDGETVEPVTDFIFLGSKITEMVTAAMKLKDFCCDNTAKCCHCFNRLSRLVITLLPRSKHLFIS